MPTVSGVIYDSAASPVSGRTVRAYRRDTGALLGSAVSSNNTEVPGDTNYTQTSLLLRCNGADASTTVTDESATPKTVTVNGNAQLDTAQKKWGSASLLLDGTGDYLTVAADAAFGFGVGAWTCEAQVRPAASTLCVLIDTRQSGTTGATRFLIGLEATTRTLFFQYGATVIGNTGTAPATSAWSHIEVSYNGTTLYGFVEGELVWSAAVSLSLDSSVPLTIGAGHSGSNGYNGHLDDIRITKGVARHTAAFTAPTAEFYANQYVAATPLGSYSIDTAGHTGELNVVALDDVAGSTENDRIIRTTGV